jgi:hypothetical protein
MGVDRAARFVRSLGLDRNPMRRRVDRVQTVIMAVLLLVFLIAGPWLTFVAASKAYTVGARTERLQHAQRHSVVATVLTKGGLGADDTGRGVRQTVSAAYTERGVRHTVRIPQLPGDKPGAHRAIWIDRSGHVTGRPRDHTQTATDTGLAAIFMLAGVALPLLGLRALIRYRLDRLRYQQWDADWAQTAPRWTRGGKNPPNMR